MMEIPLNQSSMPFNLEYTLTCGQSFRWEKLQGWWYGVVEGEIVKIKQKGCRLIFQTFPEKMGEDFLANYFRLDDDLYSILSEINKDENVRDSIRRFHGLRVTRQDPWECLISYICATNINIPNIKRMVLNLSKEFGREIVFEGRRFYTFPEPSELAEADLNQVKACKLGFRDKRVLETSRIIRDRKFDLESLRKMGYGKAKSELLSLPGVGQKVADCVLLFSIGKLEAFPVDVWMKHTILEFYSGHFEESFVEKLSRKHSLSTSEYKEISSFGRTYFGKYAGYAQEYLFALGRARKIGLRSLTRPQSLEIPCGCRY